MKWFGRKSAGREESRPVLSRVGAGVPVIGEWPRSYEAQVRDAYLGNAVAQRAVRLVAEGVGAAPVAASSPELAALIGATSGGQGLMETLASHLLLLMPRLLLQCLLLLSMLLLRPINFDFDHLNNAQCIHYKCMMQR